MAIRLTDELKEHALAVAAQYNPLRAVLLVGSCVWLGEGQDIDVVVFVDDAAKNCGGKPCSTVAYGGMVAYRHGAVNVIAVADERNMGWVGVRRRGYAHRAQRTYQGQAIPRGCMRGTAQDREKQCQFG